MRSRLSIFALICCALVCTIVVPSGVWAESDVHLNDVKISCPESSNSNSNPDNTQVDGSVGTDAGHAISCNGGTTCFNTQGTVGVRLALVDTNGDIQSNILDYWFGTFIDPYGYLKSKNKNHTIHYIENKGMLQSQGTRKVEKTTNFNGENINDTLPGILSCTLGNRNFISATGDGTTHNTNLRYHKSVASIVKILLDYGNSNTYLDNLIEKFKITNGKKISELYLQVEPLVQFAIWRQTNQNVNTYVGTYAEVYYMLHEKDDTMNGLSEDFVKSIYLNPLFPSKSGTIPSSFVYQTEIDKSEINKYRNQINGQNNESEKIWYNKSRWPIFYLRENKLPTIGVTFIQLSIVRTCDSEARKIVTAHCQNGNCDAQYISALRDNNDTNKCVENGKVKQDCNALDPQNILLYKGVKSELSDACSKIECSDLAEDAYNRYKSISNQIGVSGSDYEEYMGWLSDLYKDNMLITAFWRDVLEANGPSCDNKDYKCEPGSSGSISNCNANTTFSDTTNIDCWQKNIAYNDINNTSDYTAYETSKDRVFSSNDQDGCKVYCNESVTFNLPNQNGTYGTKAGRIFKWGKDTDRSNSKFGSMTVKRTCQIAKNAQGGICDNNSFNPAYWAQTVDKSSNPKYGIGTLITLNYREPVSGQEISSQNLNTTLDKIILTFSGAEEMIIKPDTVYKCNGQCSGMFYNNSFTVTATYSFDYGTGFHWYSDKGNNNKIVSESSIDDDLNANYVELGYGLPTAFTSPNVSYSTYKDGNGYTWLSTASKTEGYMYATIKNIGTKKSDGTYHFDKLIKTQSKNKSNGFNVDGSLTYGCDYSIKNEMFATECVGNDNDPDYCKPTTSPKGIDVVFRTVELVNTSGDKEEQLDKAFPGMSGTGRKIGANWAEWENGNPDIVEDKANNIYNILSNAIYNEEPMYEITLDVATIQKIRKYNKSARKTTVNSEKADPYSNMPIIDGTETNGYIGYVCSNNSDESYKYCASNFLTQLKANSKISGSCISGVYGTEGSKSRAHVYSHASNGCNQSWWN